MMTLIWTSIPWLVSLFVVTFGVFYLYVKSVYRYFKRRGIPYDKPTFPFGSFAAAFQFKKSVSFTLADIYAKHRNHKIVGFFSLWTKQILIRDPDILKSVLIRDFEVFQNRGVYSNKEKDPLSAHLFSLEGDAWKFLRAKLSPTFSSGKLKNMHSTVLDCTTLLIRYLEQHQIKKQSVDCQSIFAKFAQTVIASTAFGIESDTMTTENSKFSEQTKKMVEPTLERLFTFILMFNRSVATFLNIRVVPEAVSEFFQGLIKDTIKFRELNRIIRNDYLQQLIELKKSEDEGSLNLSEDELAAQAFVFIVAGSETTAATMSFCLYELSRHPEIQDRLHRELDSLPDLSYDSVNGCQYLDMVVSETLRKYPPLGFLNRECSRDYQVPGTEVVIEKGTQVLVSVQGLHNDPDLFPDPELFNPERFSKENKETIIPYTYMPFGDGPRYCIGRRFAQMVVKTGLATLLRQFQVRRPPTAPDSTSELEIEPRIAITMVAGGL